MYGFQVKRPCIPSQKEWFYKQLNDREIICPMKWYLTEEPSPTPHHPASLESLLKNPELWKAPNQRLYIEEQLRPKLTEDVIHKIAEETILQFNCVLFCQLRQCRLTACNFGAVISAIDRNSFPKTLFNKILGDKWSGNEENTKRKVKNNFAFLKSRYCCGP